MTRAERRKLLEARIAEFKASGQNVTAWCENHDINPQQLYYWLRKERAIPETKLMWLPLEVDNGECQNSLLVKVGQVTVVIKPGFDPKLLVDVVDTL